ncbi:hypothetical protein FHG87_008771 [Trinorchestia longiramus]|nr:hypothetical protein FHG87_008771 [Trinorchestia longiramus]
MLEFKRLPPNGEDEHILSAFFMYNRIRLARLFGEETVDIVYTSKNAKNLDSLDFSKYKKCLLHIGESIECEEEPSRNFALHYMINNVCTMTSVVSLELFVCSTEMFKAISKSCPCLEHFDVVSFSSCVTDLIWFCGFNPAEVTRYIQVKGLSHQSKSVCKNLKVVKVPLTLWDYSEVVAIMLTTFTKLEDLDLLLNSYAPTIAFQLIYGFNETRYSDITNFLSLKKFRCSMVLSPSELALVVKTCPLLSTIHLSCSNLTRGDQNLLAELLPVKNLHTLNLTKADTDAFKWFLSQKGKSITDLSYIYELRDSTTRSLVEFIAKMCPKLEKLYLNGDLRASRLEDGLEGGDIISSSYSALPLKKLTLVSEFSTADVTRLVNILIWLLSPSQLDAVTFSSINPYWLSDDSCEKLFSSPFFTRAKIFSHRGLVRGLNETIRLLKVAPFLQNPQILCHDGEYEFFESHLPMYVGNYVIRNF